MYFLSLVQSYIFNIWFSSLLFPYQTAGLDPSLMRLNERLSNHMNERQFEISSRSLRPLTVQYQVHRSLPENSSLKSLLKEEFEISVPFIPAYSALGGRTGWNNFSLPSSNVTVGCIVTYLRSKCTLARCDRFHCWFLGSMR